MKSDPADSGRNFDLPLRYQTLPALCLLLFSAAVRGLGDFVSRWHWLAGVVVVVVVSLIPLWVLYVYLESWYEE